MTISVYFKSKTKKQKIRVMTMVNSTEEIVTNISDIDGQVSLEDLASELHSNKTQLMKVFIRYGFDLHHDENDTSRFPELSVGREKLCS